MNVENQGTRLLVLEAIRNFPKSKVDDILELVPGVKRDTIKSTCLYLYEQGIIDREVGPYPKGRTGGRRPYLYSIAENPQPREKAPSTGKTKKPNAVVLEYNIQELKAKVAELEQWKQDAIARHPDLAVPDIVLRARKIVAEQLESHDAHGKAETLAGKRDGTMLIRAVVAALEQA